MNFQESDEQMLSENDRNKLKRESEENECWLGFHTFDAVMAIDDLIEIHEQTYDESNEAGNS